MGHALESRARASSPSEPWTEGLVDERYRVLKRLGGGGMGEVYEVEHVRLKRVFALKLLRAEHSGERDLVTRFEREARDIAALHSDHVVSIVDSGTLGDGRPYFVMERLVGQDLRQVLAGTGELPVARAVNLGIDICLGLHAAHSAGLVHRDLKPENLFVTHGDDGTERCKLLDFGVAKLVEEDHTRPGALVGTARYMAPEQVKTGEQITPAADLFALGVVLYRCLSGQHPFSADTLERVLFRVLNETPAPLPTHVPNDLVLLIQQALAKDPQERPASALAFARALARFSPEPRNLEGIATWHVGTVVGAGTSSDDITSGDTTSGSRLEASKAAPPARRALLLMGLAALLIVATLGIEHLLFRARSASSTREERAAAPPAATSRLGSSSPPESPPASRVLSMKPPEPATLPPPRPARSAVKTLAPGASPKPPEVTPSAVEPQASAAPSLNWFDPRNPYGR